MEENKRLSDDACESLCLENQMLRTKYETQYGPLPKPAPDITPEIENVILQSLFEIQEELPYLSVKTIYEIIGCPQFEPADQLDDRLVARELERIEQLMKQNGIQVRFIAPQDVRFKYRFITEVLFDQELEVSSKAPSEVIYQYTYEDFRSDHESQIRARTDNFLRSLFNKNTDFLELLMVGKPLTPANIFSPHEVIENLKGKLAAYETFEKAAYMVKDISWKEAEASTDNEATGFSVGELKYTTVRDGHRNCFEGPFRIDFVYQNEFWCIKDFDLPGWDVI